MSFSCRYQQTDAFTAQGSSGNPAATLYLAPQQELTPEQMLTVAKQHAGVVSEVVYCRHDTTGIYLTYYSSECEVDFCGHGTVACMVGLIRDNPALLAQAEIPVHTHKKGMLTIYNHLAERDAVLIAAPAPVYCGTSLTRETVADNLGLSAAALDDALPLDIIDAGLRTLLVPLRDWQTTISLFPHEQKLKHFCLTNDIDIILIFCRETERAGHIAHTRVFAPKFGYLEDPATGSGNSAFAYYMRQNHLWDGSDCLVEQGGNDRIFNDIALSYRDGTVLFGGSATVRIDSTYTL